jgi:hypothetical protein
MNHAAEPIEEEVEKVVDRASRVLRQADALAEGKTPSQWSFNNTTIQNHMKYMREWLDTSEFKDEYDKRFPFANPAHIMIYWEREVAKVQLKKNGEKKKKMFSTLMTYLSQLVWIYSNTLNTTEGARAFAIKKGYPLPVGKLVDIPQRESVVDRVRRRVNNERMEESGVGPSKPDIDMLYPMIQTLQKSTKIHFVKILSMVLSSMHWCVRQDT